MVVLVVVALELDRTLLLAAAGHTARELAETVLVLVAVHIVLVLGAEHIGLVVLRSLDTVEQADVVAPEVGNLAEEGVEDNLVEGSHIQAVDSLEVDSLVGAIAGCVVGLP